MRIVSLLPSATEIICALGLTDQLVGVTHECDYPPAVQALPKVTHTRIPTDATSGEIDALVRERLDDDLALYTLNRPVLEALAPDLIVTQALCDVCAVAEAEVQQAACALPGAPRVINLEPASLEEVLDSLHEVAALTDTKAQAVEVVEALRARVRAVEARTATRLHRPRVAVLEWLDPPFSAGHWTPELVTMAGGREGLGAPGQKSRTLSWDAVTAWAPELVLIACCGFDTARTLEDLPLLEAVPGWADVPAVRDGRVYVIDGNQYFSRPGPRLVDSLELLAHVLHPDVHPLPAELKAPVCVKDLAEAMA
ncbi:MAG: cobalamin-binding protein [Bacteroidota bacterium]